MKSETSSYHEARAEEELAHAQAAETPGAVKAHVALADMHLEILYSDSALNGNERPERASVQPFGQG